MKLVPNVSLDYRPVEVSSVDNMVVVRVTKGLLRGEVVQNEYGGSYCSFKGIPYAQPPVGDLRFKAPQPLQPWNGVRDATQFGSVAYQFFDLNPSLGNMSEDCLHLNVYTPNTKPNSPIPVMVWIHGGGFRWGSGNDDLYGPQFLIRHDVVIVTFNYRLEALGFLCLNTPEVPGNAGMKDQVAALRWVKENISNFGGDPNNITIFGESAGAASVSYHLLSKMSKGLFRRAIAQSGAALCGWAQEFEPRERALLLAKKLGCFSEDDKELYEFFKNLPPESLVRLNLYLTQFQKPYDIHFSIVNEKDFGQERFFYGEITDVIRNEISQGIDIMTGYTQDEGLMALAIGNTIEKMVTDATYYNEFFTPFLIKEHCLIKQQLQAGNKMRKFYSNNRRVTEDDVHMFLNIDMFVYGIVLSGKIYSKKNKVFIYKFTSVSERNILSGSLGLADVVKDKRVVCHADDIPYLFPFQIATGKVDEDSEEFQMIDRTTKLWTNFAKYGNPTPDKSLGVEWSPYTLKDKKYLDIGNKLVMSADPDKEELDNWENIYKEYLPQYSNLN